MTQLNTFTAFSVAFATHLLSSRGPELTRLVDDIDEVFLELCTDFLPTFSVECRSDPKRGRSESDSPHSPPNPVQCLMSADDVAILLLQLGRRGHAAEVLKVTRKLETESGTVDVSAFESFFLPLLEALISTITWTSEQVDF